MEIYMQKIGMIRPDVNPKNSSLDLDVDWSIEYFDTHLSQVKFCIILRSLNQFKSDFKIDGYVELEKFEKFNQEDISKLIFNKACSVFMEMISLTRESTLILPNPENLFGFGSEDISSTLFN